MSVIGYWDELYRKTGPKSPRVMPLIVPKECYCVGPQNGDPVCPCRMRDVTIEDGRYVRKHNLGPVTR